jgi:hypothetical protein
MMPTITGPILNSTGQPASGVIRVRASKPFDIDAGHVTQAIATINVYGGEPRTTQGPWVLPVTLDGVLFELEQDLDGEQIIRFTVSVPEAGALTYSELLFNRGGAGGTTAPFFWDLTGGLDFPPEALVGDWGVDLSGGMIRIYSKGA